MKRIIVLGAGRVGRAIAYDLQPNFEVTSADLNEDNLQELGSKYKINTVKADLSNMEEVKRIIKDFDLVIGAVPGYMGFQTAKSVIEEGKDYVDISFFPEDPFELNELAISKKVTAIIDCGVAPGLDNIFLGYLNKKMEVDYFECLVGGLPEFPEPPFKYKAPFSPIDVLEEYMRPARLKEHGKIVVREALSELEEVKFDDVGVLEAFNTDGLRTLLDTMPHIPNMKEKTLRYPKHVEYMEVLKSAGFFNREKIQVKGVAISPMDVSAKLLFPLWQLKEGEKEFTIMRVIVRGKENGASAEYVYELLDYLDENTGWSSMARTTGFTCTAAADYLLRGGISKKGILAPEHLGEDEGAYKHIMDYLKARGVEITIKRNGKSL